MFVQDIEFPQRAIGILNKRKQRDQSAAAGYSSEIADSVAPSCFLFAIFVAFCSRIDILVPTAKCKGA